MIFRAIDGNNDWIFGGGKGSYFDGSNAINANIKTRVMSFLNDCFFDMGAGIDWFNLLGGKSIIDIKNAVASQIAASYGVKEVIEVRANYFSDRSLMVEYKVKTIYDEMESGTVKIGGVYA